MFDLLGPGVAVLQEKYSVSMTFELIDISPLLLYFIGDPLAVLWWQMSQITPFWYLKGDDE
jgi:hypothetical protein